MSLHPVVGHPGVLRSLALAHSRESLPSSLLIHGPKGVGKQRVALWLAQLLVCEAPTDEGPCGTCRSCRMALGVEHPDLHWYFPLARPKGASGDRLAGALEDARMKALIERRAEPLRPSFSDEVRGLYLGVIQNVRKRAHLRPTMAKGQVFIIGDAELLVPQESSPEAANALLKLLEEPPGDSRFILTASESGRLLATIRSRTVPLHVAPLPAEEVSTFLETTQSVDQAVADWAAQLSQGSIGRALAFLPDGDDPGPLEALRRNAYRIMSAAISDTEVDGYSIALTYPPAGARKLIDLFAFIEEWLRDLGAVAAGAGDAVLNHDAKARLEKIVAARDIAAADVALALAAVEEARELARGNVNPQLVVNGLIRRMRTTILPAREMVASR